MVSASCHLCVNNESLLQRVQQRSRCCVQSDEEWRGSEKNAEFVPSTIVSLKSKVICIMVELDPEKKRREEHGLSFCTTFTSVNTQSTGWIFASGWPTSGHRKCCWCGDKVKHPSISLSDIWRTTCHLFNVHSMLLLYPNFSAAFSKKAFLVHSYFNAYRLCLVPALSVRYRGLWASPIDGWPLLRQKWRSGVRNLWVAPICAAVHVIHNWHFPVEDAVSAPWTLGV